MAIILSVIMITVIVVPIVLVLRVAFATHDPKRAARHVEVDADGKFRLELAGPHHGELYFRFEIRGDSDSSYDLVVRGTVETKEAKESFGVRTAQNSSVEGAGELPYASSTLAVSGGRGSILLTDVRRVPCVITGRVDTGSPGELVRGWVYLPG